MTSSEKVAYLKGLMEGMKLDEASDTGKLLKVIADILGDWQQVPAETGDVVFMD